MRKKWSTKDKTAARNDHAPPVGPADNFCLKLSGLPPLFTSPVPEALELGTRPQKEETLH